MFIKFTMYANNKSYETNTSLQLYNDDSFYFVHIE